MPGLGATDPANLEAQARAELGFSRRLEQPRRISPYPGFGGSGSGGYPVWYRKQQLQRFNAREVIDVGGPVGEFPANIFEPAKISEKILRANNNKKEAETSGPRTDGGERF